MMCLFSSSFSAVGKDLVTVSLPHKDMPLLREFKGFLFPFLGGLVFVVFCLSSCHLMLKTL